MWNWCPRFLTGSSQETLFEADDNEQFDDDPLISSAAQQQPSFCTRVTSWGRTLTHLIATTGALGTAVYYNCVRDFFWSHITYKHYATNFDLADNWNDANEAQWLYGTAAMCMAILPHYLACRASKKDMPWTNAFVSILAASLAIPGWNIAAKAGIDLGEKIGLSATSAGYFAGLFTGLAEGPIQELTASLGQLLATKEEKNLFKKNPHQYVITSLKRLICSATLGAIPGDVWQFVYNAGKTNNLGAIPTDIALATAVAMGNIAYDKLKNAFLTKPIIDIDNFDKLSLY